MEAGAVHSRYSARGRNVRCSASTAPQNQQMWCSCRTHYRGARQYCLMQVSCVVFCLEKKVAARLSLFMSSSISLRSSSCSTGQSEILTC
eukprot:IDg18008t1